MRVDTWFYLFSCLITGRNVYLLAYQNSGALSSVIKKIVINVLSAIGALAKLTEFRCYL